MTGAFRSTLKTAAETAAGPLTIILKYVCFLVPLQANGINGYRGHCIYMRIHI